MTPTQQIERTALSPQILQLIEKVFAIEGEEWKTKAREDPELFVLALLLDIERNLSTPGQRGNGNVEGALLRIRRAARILGRKDPLGFNFEGSV